MWTEHSYCLDGRQVFVKLVDTIRCAQIQSTGTRVDDQALECAVWISGLVREDVVLPVAVDARIGSDIRQRRWAGNEYDEQCKESDNG